MPRKSKAQIREEFIRDQTKIARENYEAYSYARDTGEHEKYIKRAMKCDAFFRGEQWEEADLQKLEAQGRPALTINLISSTVKTIIGEYATKRGDIVFKPRRDATQETADTLTKVVAQILDDNKYAYIEEQVFSDGVIQDRGYFDIRMDFEQSLMGDIKIVSEDPVDILLDPGAKEYDPSTWKQVIKTRWMTLDDIEATYGKDKRKQVEHMAFAQDQSHDAVRFNQQTYGDVDRATAVMTGSAEKLIRRVRVIERQYYKFTQVRKLVDPNTGDMREVPQNVSDKVVESLQKEFGYQLIKQRGRKIRWTVSAADVVFKDTWSPYRSFTIIPFFPIFRRGRPIGAVHDLLSPQTQVNKVESQQLHVVNTTANSGWIVEQDSLANMDTDELEERGAETGLVMVTKKNRTPPEKIKANSIPSGLDRLGSKASENLRLISGVGSLLGAEGPEVSGVSLRAKQSRGLVQVQPMFSSLDRTRGLVGAKILELVQDFYTETRIFRITDWEDPDRSQSEMAINQPGPGGTIINNVNVGEYDVVVSTAPARDTFEETQFAEAIELRNAGVMIPDHHVIKNSHLADKREIAEQVKQMQGLGEQTPEQQQMAAMVQQMELQGMQLELAETQAKIHRLEAEAMLIQAKAESEAGAVGVELQKQGAQMRVTIEQMKNKMLEKQADLINKLQLAQMHIDAKQNLTQYQETSKRVTAGINANAQAMRGGQNNG